MIGEEITLTIFDQKISGVISGVKTFSDDKKVVQLEIQFPSWEMRLEKWENKFKRFPATARILLIVNSNTVLFRKLDEIKRGN